MNSSNVRRDLEAGVPILIYDFDGREEETDMVFYAGSISWKSVYTLRKEAGGLICYATSKAEAGVLNLDFISEGLSRHPIYCKLVKRPKYGDYPAFSLWVNHIGTNTGISDYDRYLTIHGLHKVVALSKVKPEEARQEFYDNFMSPGHVPILVARDPRVRKGHTELTMMLFRRLGLESSAVLAEMLDEKVSLSKDKAMKLAENLGFEFIEGKEILKEAMVL